MRTIAFMAGLCVLVAAQASADLMIPDSGAGDRVMLFSSVDGTLIDANWITDTAGTFAFTTPKEARVIGSEIWVSDQVVDAIHRFDLSRNFLGSITAHPSGGNIDNIRGLGSDGTSVYLTVFHGTTAMRGVASYDTSGNPTGFFQNNGSFFDAEPFFGDLLISNSTTNNIERWSTGGTLLGNFATGITFPQQIEILGDHSVLTVASIAAAGVEGVYHFNSDGSLRRFIDTEVLKGQFGEHVPRGAWLLDDGNYLIATSIGVFTYDVGDGSYTRQLASVDAQYVTFIPEPASLLMLLLGLPLVLRRRWS